MSSLGRDCVTAREADMPGLPSLTIKASSKVDIAIGSISSRSFTIVVHMDLTRFLFILSAFYFARATSCAWAFAIAVASFDFRIRICETAICRLALTSVHFRTQSCSSRMSTR